MRRKAEVRHDLEAGKEENHVRQAFQPDLAALSGWKA